MPLIFAVLGIANNALYLGLGYTGLQSVSAGLGGLIVSANPVFTAALAALLLGEGMTWRKASGLLLGIIGVTLIVWHRLSVGTDSLHGILFTLASLASIVAGTILFKLLAPKGTLWIGNGVQNLAAGIVLTPVALTFADVHAIDVTPGLIGAFAFLVLGGSILAYWLWFHLLKVCGATAASAYHFLMPPLGMLFAFIVLGEHVEVRDLLGIIPVALGIYLVTRPAKPVVVRGVPHACFHHPDRRPHRADRDRRLSPAHRSDLRCARRLSAAACEAGEDHRSRDEGRCDRPDRCRAAQPRPAFGQSRQFRPRLSAQSAGAC